MKRFKIGLFVLIVFGMFKYRSFLMDSSIKIFENLSIFPLTLAFGSVAILMGILRWKYFLRLLGYNLGFLDEVKIYFSGFATIPSFVKFSDSLRLVYMKSRGVKMVDGVSIYGIEKIVDMIMISLIFLIFVGQNTGVLSVIGLLIIGIFGLKTRKFWFKQFERFGKFRRLEEYTEAMIHNLKEFKKLNHLVKIGLLSGGVYLFQLITFSIVTGIDPWSLIPAYILGKLIITTAPTPAGLGFYETGVSVAIAGMIGAANALAAVIIYRFVILWIPIILGQISIATMSH